MVVGEWEGEMKPFLFVGRVRKETCEDCRRSVGRWLLWKYTKANASNNK